MVSVQIHEIVEHSILFVAIARRSTAKENLSISLSFFIIHYLIPIRRDYYFWMNHEHFYMPQSRLAYRQKLKLTQIVIELNSFKSIRL